LGEETLNRRTPEANSRLGEETLTRRTPEANSRLGEERFNLRSPEENSRSDEETLTRRTRQDITSPDKTIRKDKTKTYDHLMSKVKSRLSEEIVEKENLDKEGYTEVDYDSDEETINGLFPGDCKSKAELKPLTLS